MIPIRTPTKIIFNPCENKENKYIGILVNGLKKYGFEVSPLAGFLSTLAKFNAVRLLHLNWFENLDDSSSSTMWTSYLRKLVVLSAVKLGGKKLVWTMHNRLSHEKKSGKLSSSITKKLISQADAIVIHSEISEHILKSQYPKLSAKIFYIPHPDFVDVYGAIKSENAVQRTSKLKLLFIGAIKPYKNIELLIQVVSAFPDAVQLTIAGNPNSETYRKELTQLAVNSSNITLELKFIPDLDLPDYIHQADLLILPYSLESSLNSGTVILGFSYGRTVICPRIGTIDDLDAGEDIFDYTYKNEIEHLAALKKQVQHAVNSHKINPSTLIDKGHRMRELVLKKNNKIFVIEKLINLYESILDK